MEDIVFLNETDKDLYNTSKYRCKLSVCFPPEDLDDVLSTDEVIFLVKNNKCYCHNADKPKTYIIVRKRPESNGITVRDALIQLCKVKLQPCSHRFLEGFTQVPGTIEFTMSLGS
jgi:hypothetical protein